MYDNIADTEAYLAQTFVMYNGTPVQVRPGAIVDNGDIMIPIVEVGATRKANYVSLEDPGLNVRKFNVGYMQNGNDVIFLRRIPARIRQQGLSPGNNLVPADRMVALPPRLSGHVGFRDMLMKAYPTFEEAMYRLEAEPELVSVALSRDAAISRDPTFPQLMFLKYRGQTCAVKEGAKFSLSHQHQYLKELFEGLAA